jgi:hypothetical protein
VRQLITASSLLRESAVLSEASTEAAGEVKCKVQSCKKEEGRGPKAKSGTDPEERKEAIEAVAALASNRSLAF